MSFRMKTSKKTMNIFKKIERSEHLQPYCLAKISIALAIKYGYKYSFENDIDNNGLDLNRQTITGDFDLLFKSMIEINEKKHINENEYFPNILKSYIDFGAELLDHEYKYSNDIYIHLTQIDNSI